MVEYQTDNPRHRIKAAVIYKNLVGLFVYDFIAATKNPSLSHLTHFSREMFHGVHSIPPPHPPKITKHQCQENIPQKKIAQREGTWTTMN